MINITNKVKVVSYKKMAFITKDKEICSYCDKKGVVLNKEYSPETDEYYYTVLFNDSENPSDVKFAENMLIDLSKKRFYMNAVVEDNVVIARMYDSNNNMIAEGHGHIFNGKGEERVAQATYYAFFRLWKECITLKKSA